MIIERILSTCEAKKIQEVIDNLQVSCCCENFAKYLCALSEVCDNSKEISVFEKAYYEELVGENLTSLLLELQLNEVAKLDKDELIKELYLNGVYGLKERGLGEAIEFIEYTNSDYDTCRIIKNYMTQALNKVDFENSSTAEDKEKARKENQLKTLEMNIEYNEKHLAELRAEREQLKGELE